MVRGTPVTIDDVEATLRDIEGAGLKPTVRLVHQKLGRGSMSTITAHLRVVAASRAGAEVGDLPDPVLLGLRSAADQVWSDLSEAADARVREIAEAADRRVQEADTARDDAMARSSDDADRASALVGELDETRSTVRALTAERDAERATKEAAERERDALSGEVAGLRARLADCTGVAERAVADVDVARADAETRRREVEDVTRRLREIEAGRATEEIRLREQLAQRDAALADEQRSSASLTVDLARHQAQSAATATLATSTEETREALSHECRRLGRERDEAVRQAAHDQARSETAEAAQHRQTTEIERLQAHRARLSIHVDRLQTRLIASGLTPDDLPLAPDSPPA